MRQGLAVVGLASAFVALAGERAEGQVTVDISATAHCSGGGGSVIVNLEAGRYRFRPIGQDSGGAFWSWSPWAGTAGCTLGGCCAEGFLWSYAYGIEGVETGVTTTVCFNSTFPNFASASEAFTARGAFATRFVTLAEPTSVGFRILDPICGDNRGGVSLRITRCPTVTEQPQGLTSCSVPASWSASVAATGDAVAYRWYRNSQPLADDGRISGSATASLSISSVMPADHGVYQCICSNECGSQHSQFAPLEFSDAGPIIRRQPFDVVADDGGMTTLSVDAVGKGTVLYQWRRGGVNLSDGGELSGTSTATLTIGSVSSATIGSYDCVVVDECGLRTSGQAVVSASCAEVWGRRHSGVPLARYGGGMAFDRARAESVLFGGYSPLGNRDLNDAWTWNGTDWRRFTGATPSARRYHAMVYDDARQNTLLFGGVAGGLYTNETWTWNGSTWTNVCNCGPAGRESMAMAYDSARQRVVLFGGWSPAGFYGDTWEWDGNNWALRNPPQDPGSRQWHAMAYDESRGVTVLFGGINGSTVYNDTWEWDGSLWTRRFPATIPPARITHEIVYDSVRQRVVMHGGYDYTTPFLGDTWEWDGVDWMQIGGLNPGGRSTARQMVYDTSRQRVVAFGGDGATGARGDTWERLGVVWSDALAAAPADRYGGAMAFDAARGASVLFGGYSTLASSNLNDAWTWDGVGWQRFTGATPSSRRYHAMVYDAARQNVLLFGGVQGGAHTNETWTWNGTAWANPCNCGPAGREAMGLAYDSARQRVVLFGGWSPAGFYGDTWEWDGTNWALRNPPQDPGSRQWHAMAYDESRGVTVLFGGINGSTVYNDTWEWDGSTWTRRFPSNPPSARITHSMIYDAGRRCVVMHGGYDYSTPFLNDTWEWNGNAWRQTSSGDPGSRSTANQMVYDTIRRRAVLFGGDGGGSIGSLGDTWERASIDPIQVSQHPQDQSVLHGTAFSFTVTATGNGPITYRWRKDGTELSDDGRISGSSTTTLTIMDAGFEDEGEYDCVLTDDYCATISEGAVFDLICPPDFNKSDTVSVQDIFDFLAAYFAGCVTPGPIPCYDTADFNSSGVISVQDIFDFLAAYFAGC